MNITVEQLKEEAAKLGYSVVKINKRPKYIKCICGHNIHTKYFSGGCIFFQCKHCGLKGVAAKTEYEAIKNFNKAVEEEELNYGRQSNS